MTWADWIGSEYDSTGTSGMIIMNDITTNVGVLLPSGIAMIDSSNNDVYMFDEIKSNENYGADISGGEYY